MEIARPSAARRGKIGVMKPHEGFTITEFLIVLAIIAAVAGFGALGVTRTMNPLGVPGVCWLIAAVVVGLAIAREMAKYRNRKLRSPPHCRACAYNLNGNTSGICPECGTAIISTKI